MRIVVKQGVVTGVKYAVSSLTAMIIADVLMLEYYISAGIIAVLSIQGTKRETLKTVARRGIALVCAFIIAGVCFFIAGINVWAFAVYLFIFSVICIRLKWTDAIVMNSVSVTHFLSEGNMKMPMIINEALIFIIGAGIGICANIYLRKKENEFNIHASMADNEIREVLRRMAEWIVIEDKDNYRDSCFERLKVLIEKAKRKAYENYNNTIFPSSDYEIAYIEMREKQVNILEHMYKAIKMLKTVPVQALKVAEIISVIEREDHKNNPTDKVIGNMEELFCVMRKEKLPEDRSEFESRAVLYYIMKQLQELVTVKKDFKKKY